jgi:hypothetical protein
MRDILEKTVTSLFRALEASGIRYAVMRNYELFPSLKRAGDSSPHTDIDLVVDSRDLDGLRAILAGIAEEHAWDALSECDHWAQSPVRHHNIEVFRFHRVQPLEYLQVDVFHAYLLWALPFYDEAQILEGRIHDAARCLTRVDPVKENAYRLIQIHGLYPAAERKRARYQAGVLAFRDSNRQTLDSALLAKFGRFGVPAVDALARNDMKRFMRNMRLGRLRFTLKFAQRHPFAIAAYLVCRLREQVQRFHTRQCGSVLRVSVRDETQRAMVHGIMNELVRNSFMDEWSEKEAGARTSRIDRAAMEQGGIIIEWSTPDCATLDLRNVYDQTLTADMILRAGAGRHKPLFVHKAAEVHVAETEAAAR